VAKVLAGVADDAQPVGCRIEVHAEEGPVEGDGELRDQDGLGRICANGVHAAAVTHAVELLILNTKVDADQRRIRPLQAGHVADVSRPLGGALLKPHQALILGETYEDQPPMLNEICAVATVRRLGRTDPCHAGEGQGIRI
jgi:hypothetical protein